MSIVDTSKIYEVRGYELDSLGHLNNAVYFNYLEASRWDFFHNIGVFKKGRDNRDKFGLYLIVVENNIKYLNELILFEKVYIKTEYSCSGIYVLANSYFIRESDNKKIAKANVKLVFINKDRVVCNIPNEIYEIIEGEIIR